MAPRLNAANQAATTLDAAVASGDTSISVTDASVFPSAPFRATISDGSSDEIIEVGSVDTTNDNLDSLTRGLEDTTAQNWSLGDSVDQRFTAGTYSELADEYSAGNGISISSDTISVASPINTGTGNDFNIRIGSFDSSFNVVRDSDGSTKFSIPEGTNNNIQFNRHDLQLNSHKIKGVTDPDNAQEAATKNYVDNNTEADTRVDVSDSGGVVTSDTTDVQFTASEASTVSVSADGDGSATVDVSSTDNDTTYSAGTGLSLSGTTFNLSQTYSDSGTVTVTGPSDVNFGSNISVTDDTDGTVTIDATDTNTTYSAGSGLSLSGTTFSLTDSSLTVAGNSVSLGGSTTIDHADLSNIGGSDHHTRPTAGDGIVDNSNSFDARLPIEDTGTAVTDVYSINFGYGLGVIDEGDNTVTVQSDPHVNVSDDGSEIVVDATDINFGSNLTVTDDGDGSATVDAAGGTDTRVNVSDDNTQVVADATDISFTTGLNVLDDGDGSVSVEAVSTDESVRFTSQHTQYADGLSGEEIYRLQLQGNEGFQVNKIDVRQKGGGTSSNFTVDVYDAGDGTVLDSATLGSTSTAGGSSGIGNAILVRVSNSTGGNVNASITVHGTIINI